MNSGKRIAYYRLNLVLASALSIGAADSVETDNDVVRDGRGLPLIPATSLAGVLRSYLTAADASVAFGNLVEEGALTESLVRVYDGVWVGETDDGRIQGNASVSVRDGVGLDSPNKVAMEGLKFDRQIVERGAIFRTYLEVTECDVLLGSGMDVCAALESALASLDAGALALGSKTSRGMGRVSVAGCLKASFDLSNEAELDAWLDFDPFEEESWRADGDELPAHVEPVDMGHHVDSDLVIVLRLKQRGAVSVREYSTEPGRPDFEQLYVRDTRLGKSATGAEDVAVIPGTSWAGAFRSRYRSIAGDGATRLLFGDVWQEANGSGQLATKTRRSRIEFSESEIAGGGWKEITRNSIDRFTGETKEHALFKLRTHYAGETSLEIRIRCEGEEWGVDALAPLITCIADLHNGFLPVGGMTAVGHGMFQVVGASCSFGCEPIKNLDLAAELCPPGGYATPDVREVAKRLVEAMGHEGEVEAQ